MTIISCKNEFNCGFLTTVILISTRGENGNTASTLNNWIDQSTADSYKQLIRLTMYLINWMVKLLPYLFRLGKELKKSLIKKEKRKKKHDSRDAY